MSALPSPIPPPVPQFPSNSRFPGLPPSIPKGQAAGFTPLLNSIFGKYADIPFSIRFWDFSVWHAKKEPSSFEIFLRSDDAWRALSSSPDEVSLGSKYVKGEIDIQGDLLAALRAFPSIRQSLESYLSNSSISFQTSALQWTQQLSRLVHLGSIHSRRRDAASIAHHYDKSPEFYNLFLGPSMVYSCAYFRDWGNDLLTAQTDKMDLICHKLDLHAEERFMDIGCGWGSLVLHAVKNYGVAGQGVSLSHEQVDYANQRITQENLKEKARISWSDFRDLNEVHAPFDKLASVGMVEHVGHKNIEAYFRVAYQSLRPGGLFLNHGITRSAQSPRIGPSFINEYVFPDTKLLTLTETIHAAEEAGFEVRDVEDLREHYEETLHRWLNALCEKEREATTLAGYESFRVWKLYMAGCAEAFRRGEIAIHQLLLSKNAAGQSSAVKVRERWYQK